MTDTTKQYQGENILSTLTDLLLVIERCLNEIM